MRLTYVRLALVIVGAVVVVAMLFPLFARERGSGAMVCMINVHALAMGMELYASDYGVFPRSDVWTDALGDYYEPRRLKCDKDTSRQLSSYGMNSNVSAMRLREPASRPALLVIYETAHPGNSPYGGPGDIVSPPRHMGGNNYGFADGHFMWSEKIPSFKAEQAPAHPGPSRQQ